MYKSTPWTARNLEAIELNDRLYSGKLSPDDTLPADLDRASHRGTVRAEAQ
jgi:hypothetical protein